MSYCEMVMKILIAYLLLSRASIGVIYSKVFFKTQFQDTSNYPIIAQLGSISKLQCLHQCKMMKGTCSDIVFEQSGIGHCLLLKPSDSNLDPVNDLEEALRHLGMSEKNSVHASSVDLPVDEDLQSKNFNACNYSIIL